MTLFRIILTVTRVASALAELVKKCHIFIIVTQEVAAIQTPLLISKKFKSAADAVK